MPMRTGPAPNGPLMIIFAYPAGSTDEQLDRAYEAAQRVFDDAGVDPVEAGHQDNDDPQRREYLAKLWETAEQAATETC
jgi:hypothetical protein